MSTLNTYSILFIEDDPILRNNYAEALRTHFKNVYVAPDAYKGYELYQEKKPHIMIVDINLPGMSGLKFLEKIRATDQNTKAIVLTAHSSKEFLLQAVSLKLNDYLVKPVSRRDFHKAIEKSIQEIESFIAPAIFQNSYPEPLEKKIQNRLKELTDENAKLLHLSMTDKLTGLFNRTKLDEAMEEQFQIVKRYKSTFSIMLMDVDFFKLVNDNYGHNVGDNVLIDLSNLLKINTRKTDIVGRWGGEEFMIICPKSNADQTKTLALKIKEKVGKHCFKSYDKQITVSIGICEYKENYSFEQILIFCDKALYQAKIEGRNKVVVY